ncbi:cyclic nucleotide-binding domain partial [Nannochloropsis oceanica]
MPRSLRSSSSSHCVGRRLSSSLSPSPSSSSPPVTPPPSPAMKFGPPKGGHALLHFGNACALLSFSMTDVFLLRSLAMVATTCGVIYNITHSPPLRVPAIWGLVFLTVNGTMILSLLMEDKEIAFSKEELVLFEEHFLPYSLTPTQFRKLIAIAQWKEVPAGTTLAEEGERLTHLILISKGKVAAFVNQVPIQSFSTFPGAKDMETNKGIDSGAWIGEINFLDEEKKAKGAIATFVTESPTRFVCWEHARLKGLLLDDAKLSRSVTHAINGALIGKLLSFTNQTKDASTEAYSEIMTTVLVDHRVEPSEKAFIREYRKKHGITEAVHSETLAKLGWTTEEFEDGSKHDKAFNQETVGALRRINEGLIRRQTIMAQDEDEEQALGKVEELADRSAGKE